MQLYISLGGIILTLDAKPPEHQIPGIIYPVAATVFEKGAQGPEINFQPNTLSHLKLMSNLREGKMASKFFLALHNGFYDSTYRIFVTNDRTLF
ncbi:hypothetical protein N7522_012217 [Penicillium canescens]|nr:hypothetical protein N7522_012217 [Penicillium canescens]